MMDPTTEPRVPAYGRRGYSAQECREYAAQLWHLFYLESQGADIGRIPDYLVDFHFFVRSRDVLGRFIAEHSSEEVR